MVTHAAPPRLSCTIIQMLPVPAVLGPSKVVSVWVGSPTEPLVGS